MFFFLENQKCKFMRPVFLGEYCLSQCSMKNTESLFKTMTTCTFFFSNHKVLPGMMHIISTFYPRVITWKRYTDAQNFWKQKEYYWDISTSRYTTSHRRLWENVSLASPPCPHHLCPQHTKTYIHTHNKALKEVSYKEMTINF